MFVGGGFWLQEKEEDEDAAELVEEDTEVFNLLYDTFHGMNKAHTYLGPV